MMKKIWIVVILLCLLSFFLFSRFARAPKRPNVILVSLDTLRADRLRCYGYDRETSPFLDSIAREGILFENTIVQSNWTLPSHVSMLTSLYPATHRVRRKMDKMSTSLLTMAEILKGKGYATAAFVDDGMLAREFGFDQGFDLYDDRSVDRLKDRRAIRWIKRHRDKPFFLFYHTYDTHFPYRFHPGGRRYSDGAELERIRNMINSGAADIPDQDLAKAVVACFSDRPFLRSIDLGKLAGIKPRIDEFIRERWRKLPAFDDDRRYLSEAYDAGIEHVDTRMKRIWERIRKMELSENTVLIVTSDHGECILGHGAIGHPELLYDEILRVPLIIHNPGLKKRGLRIKEQVTSIDILPTVLDMLGIPIPETLQGRSLLPLIYGKPAATHRPAFSDARHFYSVRDRGWKFIRGVARAGEDDRGDQQNTEAYVVWAGLGGPPHDPESRELYELAKDPSELNSLARKEPETCGGLERLIEKWDMENNLLSKKLGLDKAPEKATLEKETVERLRTLGYFQ